MIPRDLAAALAAEFGTPLFLYDLDEVELRTQELLSVLPHGARLYYSMKANPLPAVAEAARLAGARAEISSEGELAAAIESGFAPEAILYTGPAKNGRELRRAMAEGVRWFAAESETDLRRIAAAALAQAATAQVILRVNPEEPPRTRLAMTGVPSQFGFGEAELCDLGPSLASIAGVRIEGVQVYLGTQADDAAASASMFGIALEAAERLASRVPLRVIDLGGGFPWPFAVEGRGPDLVPLAAALRTLLESAKLGDGVEFWFESGRYIAASSGMLLTRVMEVKRSRATVFYLLDTGIAHLGGMSGIGRVLRPAASLLPLRMESSGNTMVADVVGPLCTPLDCLARSAKVPEVEAGEIVAIPNTGAYGATASLTNFLGRPTATEVSLRDGRVVNIARLRAGHEQLLRNQGEFCDD